MLLPTKEITARDRLREVLDLEYLAEHSASIALFKGYDGPIPEVRPEANAIRLYEDGVEVMLDDLVGEVYDDGRKYMARFVVEK